MLNNYYKVYYGALTIAYINFGLVIITISILTSSLMIYYRLDHYGKVCSGDYRYNG